MQKENPPATRARHEGGAAMRAPETREPRTRRRCSATETHSQLREGLGATGPCPSRSRGLCAVCLVSCPTSRPCPACSRPTRLRPPLVAVCSYRSPSHPLCSFTADVACSRIFSHPATIEQQDVDSQRRRYRAPTQPSNDGLLHSPPGHGCGEQHRVAAHAMSVGSRCARPLS